MSKLQSAVTLHDWLPTGHQTLACQVEGCGRQPEDEIHVGKLASLIRQDEIHVGKLASLIRQRPTEERVPQELLDAVTGSEYCMTINPTQDGVDMKIAVETGLMILLNKPILLLVMRGHKPLPGLLRVADVVVVLDDDLGDPTATAQIQAGLRQLKQMFPQGVRS